MSLVSVEVHVRDLAIPDVAITKEMTRMQMTRNQLEKLKRMMRMRHLVAIVAEGVNVQLIVSPSLFGTMD